MCKRLNNIELFLLDMDGTVYLSDQLIDGSKETIDRLISDGKRVAFLTNNSSKSTEQYIEKLSKMGIKVNNNDICNSIKSAIFYLNNHCKGKKVYLLATDTVSDEFSDNGICLTDNAPDIVLLTYDRSLTYDKLEKACKFIRNGADYYVTHSDKVCPSIEGDLPDVGSFIELIKATTGLMPHKDFGKPSINMYEYIKNKYNLQSDKIAMVGDRLYTDIRFGNRYGYTSILVLSGETDYETYINSSDKADIVIDSLKDIYL